ncbi:MAG: ferrochelatase [Desulfotalea sp.]
MRHKSIGIILLNMGGPTTLNEVRPFLFNLFSDREIIPLGPAFLQKPLAWLIAKKRAPKSIAIYENIGGASPLYKITCEQAEALELCLSKHGEFYTTVAMRYWPPHADEAIKELLEKKVEKIIALTLYPHYSKATTGSSLAHLRLEVEKRNLEIPIIEISSWPTSIKYVNALASNILDGLKSFSDNDKVHIIYSAHSLPVSFIEAGDPYVEHTHQTISAIEQITGVNGTIAFQSRSGPVKWLEPSTPDLITRLAGVGVKNILMVPISFVSDHVETLYEIDMLYKDQAKDLGVNLKRCASLNCQPEFIDGLRDLILEKLHSNHT